MARFTDIDTSPRFIPIDLARQLLPGTFEHAVNHLFDHAIDLTRFDARFRTDVNDISDIFESGSQEPLAPNNGAIGWVR